MEYALPSIEVLYRLRKERPDVFDKLEGVYILPPIAYVAEFCLVYMDGGVRRGTGE
jgi:L-lactate dehydrogenase (cytochrome)